MDVRSIARDDNQGEVERSVSVLVSDIASNHSGRDEKNE